MKKKVFTLIILLSLLFQINPVQSQKKYDSWFVMQEDHIPSFSKLKIRSALDVFIYEDSYNHFKILAQKDAGYYTRYSIEGNTIEWYKEKNNSNLNQQKEVVFLYLKAKQLEELVVSGASDVEMADKLSQANFKLKMSGASDVNFAFSGDKIVIKCSGASDLTAHIKANLLISEISGASDVYLEGKVISHKAEISGASDLDAQKLKTNVSEIIAGGTSDVTVNANKLIKQINGMSEVDCVNAQAKIETINGRHYSLFDDFSFLNTDVDIDVVEKEDGSLHIKIGDFSIILKEED
jgi:hypothetical protein